MPLIWRGPVPEDHPMFSGLPIFAFRSELPEDADVVDDDGEEDAPWAS